MRKEFKAIEAIEKALSGLSHLEARRAMDFANSFIWEKQDLSVRAPSLEKVAEAQPVVASEPEVVESETTTEEKKPAKKAKKAAKKATKEKKPAPTKDEITTALRAYAAHHKSKEMALNVMEDVTGETKLDAVEAKLYPKLLKALTIKA